MAVNNTEIYIFGGFNGSNLIINGFLKVEYLQDKKEIFSVCN